MFQIQCYIIFYIITVENKLIGWVYNTPIFSPTEGQDYLTKWYSWSEIELHSMVSSGILRSVNYPLFPLVHLSYNVRMNLHMIKTLPT